MYTVTAFDAGSGSGFLASGVLAGYLPPELLPALPATCVMECMKTYRPFLFQH